VTTSSMRYAKAMQVLEQSIVIFSQNYLPLCRINIKQAIALLITNKAQLLGFTMQVRWRVNLPSLIVDIPKHICLEIASSERKSKIPPGTWQKVLQQSHHSCQYCGNSKHLTLNDVIGQSKSGRHTEDNVVTAVERCNSSKGDRIPLEAGMQQQKTLTKPVHPAIYFAKQYWIDVQANLE
jgi:5-methylcytosine-specific restriction endonuclease McrA